MDTARGNGAPTPLTVRERIEQIRQQAADRNHSAAIVAQLASKDPGDPVEFKIGTEILKCRMVLASSEEEFEATALAWARLAEKGLRGTPDELKLFTRCELSELVAISLRDPQSGERIFRNVGELEATIDEPTLVQLQNEYEAKSEIVDIVPNEQRDKIVELIKKKAGDSLSDVARSMPRSYLLTTVNLLCDFLEGRFSTGDGSQE